MYDNDYTKIKNYLKTNARNKIVFYCNDIADIEPINIGIEVSQRIFSDVSDIKLSLKTKQIIDDILVSSIIKHEVYGKFIAITNIGILLEKDLRVDIINLFDRFSCVNALFVKWNGEIESGNLFFQSKQNGIKLELESLSYIIL